MISIEQFETHVETKVEPTEYAKILDDYQYRKCREAERYDKNNRKRDILLEKGERGSDLLTALSVAAQNVKIDPERYKLNLDKVVTRIEKFFLDDAKREENEMYEEMGITPELKPEPNLEF